MWIFVDADAMNTIVAKEKVLLWWNGFETILERKLDRWKTSDGIQRLAALLSPGALILSILDSCADQYSLFPMAYFRLLLCNWLAHLHKLRDHSFHELKIREVTKLYVVPESTMGFHLPEETALPPI